MPRVLFSQNFCWHARHNVTISYQAGREYPVTQRCAAEAVAKGFGAVVERLTKSEPDHDDSRTTS